MFATLIPIFFLYCFSILSTLGTKKQLLVNQMLFFIIGLVLIFVIRKVRRKYFEDNSRLLYFVFIAVLIGTYLLGLEVKGSRRWIELPFFNFQPSEFFKVFFVLFMSQYLSKKHIGRNNFSIFIGSLVYFLIPTFIIFKQPDLGNAIVYGAIYITMIIFSRLPKRYLLYIVIFLTLSLPLGWGFMKSYQRERIVSFISPHVDTSGNAYNMIQAIITTGSGQWVGRGMGAGTQSRLAFLPENHTDFAFASMIEQFGFFGGLLVLGLYAYIISRWAARAFWLMSHPTESSQAHLLYIVGFTTIFIVQIGINMGMNLGLMPVAGITLPFISYGGSSVVAFMVGIALLPISS